MEMSDFGSAISCIGIREGVLAVTAEVIWRSEAAVKPSYGAVKMLTMLQGSRALSPSLPAEGLIGHGGRSCAASIWNWHQRRARECQMQLSATLATARAAAVASSCANCTDGPQKDQSRHISRGARTVDEVER